MFWHGTATKFKNRPPPVLPLFYYVFPFPTASAISAWWQYESCSFWAKRSHTQALPPNASLRLKATKDASAVRTFKFSQISRREQERLFMSRRRAPHVLSMSAGRVQFLLPDSAHGRLLWLNWVAGDLTRSGVADRIAVFREPPQKKLLLLWRVGQKLPATVAEIDTAVISAVQL